MTALTTVGFNEEADATGLENELVLAATTEELLAAVGCTAVSELDADEVVDTTLLSEMIELLELGTADCIAEFEVLLGRVDIEVEPRLNMLVVAAYCELLEPDSKMKELLAAEGCVELDDEDPTAVLAAGD